MFVPPAGAPPEAPEPIAKAVAVLSAVGSIMLGLGAFLLFESWALNGALAL